MTVYENVAFAMRVIGAKEKEIRERVPYVLELVGLDSKATRHPNELSGGEQQRLAIARALVNNPSTIIADEPTGNLDSRTGEEILQLFRDIRSDRPDCSLIMITHNAEIAAMADRSAVLADGMIR